MGEILSTVKTAAERICLRAPLWQVVAMIPCFAAILLGHLLGAYAAFSNLDGSFPHPVAFGLVMSACGLFWMFLGAFFFLAAGRERIWVFDDAIVQRGIFFTRRIEFRDLLALHWRPSTFRVVVEGPHTRIAIWLNSFSFATQQRVIEHLRTAIPKDRHQNFRKFRRRHEEFHCIPRDMTVQEARNTVAFVSSLLALTSAGFVAAWFGGVEGPLLEVAVMCAIAVVSYVWRYYLFKKRVGGSYHVQPR